MGSNGNGNHSTRSLATKLIVGAFVLSFLVLTCLLIYCVGTKADQPMADALKEIYVPFLIAMTGLVNSIVGYYFLSKKRPDENGGAGSVTAKPPV